jgi:hypothetical protein
VISIIYPNRTYPPCIYTFTVAAFLLHWTVSRAITAGSDTGPVRFITRPVSTSIESAIYPGTAHTSGSAVVSTGTAIGYIIDPDTAPVTAVLGCTVAHMLRNLVTISVHSSPLAHGGGSSFSAAIPFICHEIIALALVARLTAPTMIATSPAVIIVPVQVHAVTIFCLRILCGPIRAAGHFTATYPATGLAVV